MILSFPNPRGNWLPSESAHTHTCHRSSFSLSSIYTYSCELHAGPGGAVVSSTRLVLQARLVKWLCLVFVCRTYWRDKI